MYEMLIMGDQEHPQVSAAGGDSRPAGASGHACRSM